MLDERRVSHAFILIELCGAYTQYHRAPIKEALKYFEYGLNHAPFLLYGDVFAEQQIKIIQLTAHLINIPVFPHVLKICSHNNDMRNEIISLLKGSFFYGDLQEINKKFNQTERNKAIALDFNTGIKYTLQVMNDPIDLVRPGVLETSEFLKELFPYDRFIGLIDSF